MNQNDQFATTQWSVVRQAGLDESPEARSALESLCQRYWYPLYSFVRFKGYNANDAEDLTQSFFAALFQRKDFQKAQPELGRFRSFLLTALKNFLANDWNSKQAQKRGGQYGHLSIDYGEADSRYSSDPASGKDSPEEWFERQWALTLLARVNSLQEDEFRNKGKLHVFQALAPFLAGKNPDSTFAETAAKLEMTEVAIKVAVHRMRAQFGQLLRSEIQNTLDGSKQIEGEIDGEIARLFEILKR